MATLLMIEGWLQSTGLVLPSLIRERGHEYVLVTSDSTRTRWRRIRSSCDGS